ncbi:hypothetical protein INT48_001279 [Thamnidium elegans]|uniref:Zincin n=1 Tax=Thamnidium elegans TaxID=101142 RepID=A0A8H7SLB7_9FUNG|nr:hypothetical protein INT48_001279 [Thamnidium elegans]
MPPTPVSLFSGSSNICTTPLCYNISETLKYYVNLNADPCSDFFQYTCGSWVESDRIKNTENQTGSVTELYVKNSRSINEILAGTFDELYTSIATDDKAYHTQDQKHLDEKNFNLVKDYYSSCIDEESKQSVGSTPLFPYLANIENSLLPITDEINPQNLANAIVSSVRQGVSTLFSVAISRNFEDTDYDIMYVAGIPVDTKINYDVVDELVAYRDGLKELLINSIGGSIESPEYQQLVVEESQKSNFTVWSASKIDQAVNSFVSLEIQFFKATIVDVNYEPLGFNEIFRLSDLIEISPSVDWNLLVSSLVSESYAATNPPIYLEKNYIEVVEAAISASSTEILQEYFVIKTLKDQMSSFKTPGSSDLSLTSNAFRAPSSKDPEPTKLITACSTEVQKKFKDIMGRFFILKTIGASKPLEKLEEMTNMIHSTWLQDILPETDWVDEETKAKIIHKIKLLHKRVGYSTSLPVDWRDPSTLDAYYTGIQDNNSTYYDRSTAATVWENTRTWKSLVNKRDPNVWIKRVKLSEPNASYYPDFNTIEILPGIFQEPFFSVDYPAYLNYGGLGAIVGHELVHALDTSGRLFNATGFREDWFSESSITTYDEKAQCFIDQFDNFTLAGLDDEQIPLDGTKVLGENIADSGGLSIALHAYRKYILENGGIEEKRLPGFEHLSPEQLFFVSHGLFTCEIIPKSSAQLKIDTDEHAATYYRNIGIFQNSQEFAEAYNCPEGSPMNPTKKCSIW